MADPAKYFSVGQAAKELGISIAALRQWVTKGWIHCSRRLPSGHRQFTRSDISDCMRKMEAAGNSREAS